MAATTHETNTQRTARAYAAFSAGDFNTLSEFISPDCVWIVGGDNRLTGNYHGRDATFDYFGKLVEATAGTFTLSVLTINEVVPDTVIVTAHAQASARDRKYDEEIVQQLHLRNGQVIACRTFVENGHLWDALIGPARITLPAQGLRESVSSG
jgi:ketosteroid isomerase-like protein